MQIQYFKNSEHAVVGVVVAVLLVGLIVVVVSLIQTVYVPKWMKQKEAEHMDVVADQFAQLKSAIDLQTVIQLTETPTTTSITLGSTELPFLLSNKAFGSMDITPNTYTINLKNASKIFSYSFGTIKYSSINAYFLNQNYIYETGAVILHQDQGDVISIKPSFSVNKEKNVTISFTLINISTIGEKRSVAGFETTSVQTEFLNSHDVVINNVSNMSIKTEYQHAWQGFFNRTLKNAGLNYDGYGRNYTITIKNGMVIVKFYTPIIVNFYLKVIKIGAQMAPGWIENIKG